MSYDLYLSVPADRGKNIDSDDIFFAVGQPPKLCTVDVEVHCTFCDCERSQWQRFDVRELILSLDNDEFRLSSGKESGSEGLEVHGYLPAPSEIPEREIGGGDHHI